MAGYTPVFDSVFKGSLYGKWPDTAAWICMLALADWRGHIDITPEAIAGMTGMPLPELMGCIERFCQPDPRSRSQAEEGRKLVPIDVNRDWGWRVVNIQKYREKARDQTQIADGRNAEKVRRYKERHRKTPEDTDGNQRTLNSDSYTNSDSNKEKREKPALRAVRSRKAPAEFSITEAMREWARAKCPNVDLDAETEKFRDHEFRDPHSDWLAAWRQWIRRSPEFAPRAGFAKPQPPAVTWRPPADEDVDHAGN